MRIGRNEAKIQNEAREHEVPKANRDIPAALTTITTQRWWVQAKQITITRK